MPIQLVQGSNPYNQIPDCEDVTSLDRPVRSHVKKWLHRSIVLAFLSLLLLGFMGWKLFTINDDRKTAVIYTTSRGSDILMARKVIDIFPTLPSLINSSYFHKHSRLTVSRVRKYQKIIGFGGAFTESSALNYFNLSPELRQKFLDLCFSTVSGLGYTLGRIHINSCDFSSQSYSFDDVKDDYDLQYFDHNVTHDREKIIPFLLAAMNATNAKLRLLASPWSPPAWMKRPVSGQSTSSMLGSDSSRGLKVDPIVQQVWASYISYFISAYKAAGVPIWALTPQNEPEFAAPWEACVYNASTELQFIENYLGPTLEKQHPDLRILAFDHNKDHLFHWAKVMFGSGKGRQYVDGMAFHWYTGNNDRYLDGTYGYNAINQSFHLAPEKILLATEACSCPGVELGNWLRAERAGHDIMYDLLNHAQGWIDWNLLVDHIGGPNHLKNYCDASLIVDEGRQHLLIQPKYHYLYHFAHFLPPESQRIESSFQGSFGYQNVDPRVRSGLEASFYRCEQSSRQIWEWQSNDNTISLRNPTRTDIDDPSLSLRDASFGSDMNRRPSSVLMRPQKMCLGQPIMVDPRQDRPYLTLVNCPMNSFTNKDALSLVVLSNGQIIDATSGHCVTLADGVREAGALIILAPCIDSFGGTSSAEFDLKKHQLFKYDSSTGEIHAAIDEELCLTAGTPFFTGISFEVPDQPDQITSIVMNEAPISTRVMIFDTDQEIQATFELPPRSIQTIVF